MTSADSIDHQASTDRDGPLLICYDGSDHAKYAIRSAAGLLGDRKALVLTVWQPAADLGAFAGYTATTDTLNFAELDRAGAETGGALANEGARAAQAAGILRSRSPSKRQVPSGRRSSTRPTSITRRRS